MENLSKQRPLFIGLSCLSISCLVGSFAYPLQKLELYRQVERGTFDTTYVKTFIITENALDKPYGFDSKKAKKFAQIYHPSTYQKILLLILASGCAIAALSIGNEILPTLEIEEEVNRIRNEGKKELKLKSIRHHFAMASKSQQLLFLDEIAALMEEFGSPEQEMLEADEINALYAEASQIESETTDESKPTFRTAFPEELDAASLKAINKANGCSDDELIKDVLGCSDLELGKQYLIYLRSIKSE